jgi:hypothetical protein
MTIAINGSGTITGVTDFANSSVGRILNVSEVQITSTSTHNSNGGHTRFAAMDTTYTTQYTGSKILVIFNFSISNSNTNSDASPKLFRKIGSGTATEIYVNPSLVGSTTSTYLPNFRGASVFDGAVRNAFVILDNPGHTAGDVLTYEHRWRTESVNELRLNYGGQTGDGRFGTTISTVMFLEVPS